MKTNLKSNSILLGGLLLLGTVFSCTQAPGLSRRFISLIM